MKQEADGPIEKNRSEIDVHANSSTPVLLVHVFRMAATETLALRIQKSTRRTNDRGFWNGRFAGFDTPIC